MLNLIYKNLSSHSTILVCLHEIDAEGAIKISIQFNNLDTYVKHQLVDNIREYHLVATSLLQDSSTIYSENPIDQYASFVFDDVLNKIVQIILELQFIPTNNAQSILQNIVQITQKLRRQVLIEKPDINKLSSIDPCNKDEHLNGVVRRFLEQEYIVEISSDKKISLRSRWHETLKRYEKIFQEYLEHIQNLTLVDFIWLCEEETDIFSYLANKHNLYEKFYHQHFLSHDKKSPRLSWREVLLGKYYLHIAQNAYQVKEYLDNEINRLNNEFNAEQYRKSWSCISFYEHRYLIYLQKSAKKYCFHAMEACIFFIYGQIKKNKEAKKEYAITKALFTDLNAYFSKNGPHLALQGPDIQFQFHDEPNNSDDDNSEKNEYSKDLDEFSSEDDLEIAERDYLLTDTCVDLKQKYGSVGYFRLAQYYQEISISFETFPQKRILILQKALTNFIEAKKSYHQDTQLPLSCYQTENLDAACDNIMHNKLIYFTATEYQNLCNHSIDHITKLLLEARTEQIKSQSQLQILPTDNSAQNTDTPSTTISTNTTPLLWRSNQASVARVKLKRGQMELSDLVDKLTETIQDHEQELSIEEREKIQKVKAELDALKNDIINRKRIKPS